MNNISNLYDLLIVSASGEGVFPKCKSPVYVVGPLLPAVESLHFFVFVFRQHKTWAVLADVK